MRWELICESLVMAMVVLVFLTIYRKRQSTCTWNWIAGWIFVGIHFLLQALMAGQQGLLLSILDLGATSCLVVSGVMFFLATIEQSEDTSTQRLLALAIAFSSILYIAIAEFSARPLLLAAGATLIYACTLVVWYRYFRLRPYSSFLFCLGTAAYATALYCVLHGISEYPIVLGLSELFCFTALSYWRRFHRPSAGVIIAVIGFLAWGGVFMAAEVVEFLSPGLIPESSGIWNAPKYFVAAAMILTLLEDEIGSAQRLMRRYRLQFDRSLSGVFRCTAGGEMLECNEAFARIFQRRRGELENSNVADLLSSSDGSGSSFMERLAAESQVMGMEFAVAGDSGVTRQLIGNATLVRDADGASEIHGTVLDITDFKALQDQIRDSQKLEALGLLAGGIAHDFNNLLMVISGHMELLELSMGSNAQSHAALEAVKSATQRGASITGQLLAFSRKGPTEKRPLDINALLQQTRSLFRPVLGEKITLEARTCPGKLDVFANENQLIMVLLNMVINSRDAMPEGGRVVLESSMAELDEGAAKLHGLTTAGQYVCVGVSDTGCGIPAEIKARVFEPFFTTKPTGKGTGLGLSICYGIIQQHQGTITVASSPGIGTTLRIYLPMTAGAAESAATARVSSANVKGARILLVDDEDLLREPACNYFRQAGFAAFEASSSSEALRLFRDQPFDLVVTDMVMPEMNGMQLAGELRKIAPALPIIYVSGYAQDILEHQGHLPESDLLLQKPYSLKRLVRLAEETLEKRGLARAATN
jgi:PAS domain S-box-containing protein